MLQSGSSHPNEQRGEEGNRMGSNCKRASENVTVQKVKKKKKKEQEEREDIVFFSFLLLFFLLS